MEILITNGYGAGWSTWSDGAVARYMLTYEPIINALKNGEKLSANHKAVKQLQKDCKDKFGKNYVCVAGVDELIVVDVVPPFVVQEYDGSEYVETPSDIK